MRAADAAHCEIDPGARFGSAGIVARPALFERLGSARVSVVSAPAGSGKTVLLQSWIDAGERCEHAAWVSVRPNAHEPQWFWHSITEALRRTRPGAALLRPVAEPPETDGWLRRLLEELAPLREPLWLVIDDLHELTSAETLRQLELLMMRAPLALRFVLATRHDPRLGLHRLRVEGGLAEIRAADLRFTPAQTRELLEPAGVRLPDSALAALQQRTEGWAAGLRLAALSLADHPDPVRGATEFSGSERTVAEYLLAEVLDRQSAPARRLLLRTSILERVSGELADLLTGDTGGERLLQDLEQANAFVSSLDATRSWFRPHRMFADMLRQELRNTAPGEIAGLHRTAAGWLAAHGRPVAAIRHAQAARDWGTAARMFADRWPDLLMDARMNTAHELLAGFPEAVLFADGELMVMAAADRMRQAPEKLKGHYLRLAEAAGASVPAERRAHAQLMLGMIRLLLANQRWDVPAATAAARQLKTAAPGTTLPGGGADLRALALVHLGTTEAETGRFEAAARHLELGGALARRTGRPYLEFVSLAYLALTGMLGSFDRGIECGEQAMKLARQHGWTDKPAAAMACSVLASVRSWRGRAAEAEQWLAQAEQTLGSQAWPSTVVAVHYTRGLLELARGRNGAALAAFRTAERGAERLAARNIRVTSLRAFRLRALVRLGESARAAAAFAALDVDEQDRAEVRLGLAALRITTGEPRAALDIVAPVLAGVLPLIWPGWLTEAFLLAAIAHDALDEAEAAEAAVERALDAAESDGLLLWFVLYPVPGLLERRVRSRSSHAALIAEIQNLLAVPVTESARPAADNAPPAARSPHRAVAPTAPPSEPLSDSEIRVLRYLPTHLSVPAIARELSLSPNTVKTHMRNVYAKLGVHRRAEAVGRARALGLLAPVPGRR